MIRIGSHFRQEIRAFRVFHDVHNPEYNGLVVMLLLKHDGTVQYGFHDVHKHGVTAHHPDHLACKIALLDIFCHTN